MTPRVPPPARTALLNSVYDYLVECFFFGCFLMWDILCGFPPAGLTLGGPAQLPTHTRPPPLAPRGRRTRTFWMSPPRPPPWTRPGRRDATGGEPSSKAPSASPGSLAGSTSFWSRAGSFTVSGVSLSTLLDPREVPVGGCPRIGGTPPSPPSPPGALGPPSNLSTGCVTLGQGPSSWHYLRAALPRRLRAPGFPRARLRIPWR